ncbi:hypothetical protein RIF23_07820 [Lipingzhangella sp. LS1_29]|uniref:DUF4190 domain-containing protein n=1 Tax=Lipingzhangella rawalii TaxID=2055835 RepID=A0ABU2H6E7_9ACTN|nr:hypothetical protein [Lipingzhangella rawalii]MDS1270199.1 hypothetical protein [Lipingzhangella rawalii]
MSDEPQTRQPQGSRSTPRPHPADDTTADSNPEATGPHAGSSAFMVLVLHMFTFVCCANWIFGPLGIVLAARGAMARDRGRYTQADNLVWYAWLALGAGLVMLLVMIIVTVVLLLLGIPFLQEQAELVPY